MFLSAPGKSLSFAKIANIVICILLILSITQTAAADSSDQPYRAYLPSIMTGNWSYTFVDSPKYFSDLGTRAIQFDSNENPCVVYGNDHLYYACWNGAKWVYEVVDEDPGVGRFATLAFDTHGNPHIAYYDETNAMLRYAYWDGSLWQIDFVDGYLLPASPELDPDRSEADGAQDTPQDSSQLDPSAVEGFEASGPLLGLISHKQGVGGYPSLAVDKQNQAHIAYYDFGSKNLKYAVKENGAWSKGTVDSAGDVGTFPSLAVTSSGSPIIAYYDATNGKLKLATQSGSTWTRITLDGSDSTTDNNVGLYASLVLDSADQPRIAYYNSSARTLKYWRSGSAKTLGTNMGQYASLRLHPDGRAFITYFNEADQNLAMISLTSAGSDGEWVVDQVDSDSYVGRMGSLAISKTGLRGIVYYHSANSELRYALINSGGAKIQVVDTSSVTGFFADLALVAGGTQPRIAYLNDSQNRLMYAYLESNVWKTEVISALNNTGVRPSLAVSAKDVAHVTFRQADRGSGDGTISSLRYAYRNSSGWSGLQIVDQGVNMGDYSSLAINASGNPYASYYDGYNKNLKYARKVSGSWVIETVDSGGDVGKYSSLALDSYSLPWISYYDDSNDNLKVAHKNISGSWSIWTVASTDNVGTYTSIAIGPGSIPYVVFRDATNNQLKLSYYKSGTWFTEVIDSAGSENSVFVTNNGTVAVSYYDASNYNLKFAFKIGGTWVKEITDRRGDVGMYNSLACTADNICAVGYMDATNGDLKYAVRGSIP